MRVCLVSREFAPFWGAGIGAYASQMAGAWAGAGHEVHVLTPPHPGLVETGPKLRPGVVFHTPDVGQTGASTPTFRFDFLRHAMAVYQTLQRLHAAAPFDYIEFPEYWAEGYFAIRAKRTLGTFPGAVLGVRLHTPTLECRQLNGESWLDEELATLEHAEESTIKEADLVLSPSASLLDQLSLRLKLEPDRPHRGVVVYPFQPDSGWDTDPAAAKGPSDSGDRPAPTVLYFGRMERRKGVQLLIQAGQAFLRGGGNATFRFIGADTSTGPQASSMVAHLRSLVEPKWQDRFEFEPARPRAELAAVIRAVARSGGVCCFPSLWENFPNACVEAMALGAAVVGSDAGGMAEIIQDGRSGLLFKSGDAASLTDALRRALDDAGLRTSLAAAAPGRVASLCNPATVVGQTIAAVDKAKRAMVVPPAASDTQFSVVLPVVGSGAGVRATLDSVTAQTRPPREVIAVSADGQAQADWGGGVRAVAANGAALAAGLREAVSPWVVWVRPGITLDHAFLERVSGAIARDPGLAMVGALAATQSGLAARVPVGLDRDLLPAVDCGWSGALAVRREMLLPELKDWAGPGEEWAACCALAAAGHRSTVIPELLIAGDEDITIPPADTDRVVTSLAQTYPALAARPDRVVRLMAWRRSQWRETAQRAFDTIAANRARIASLESDLERDHTALREAQHRAGSMRYRVADRAAGVLELLRIRRAIWAAAALVWGRERSTKPGGET